MKFKNPVIGEDEARHNLNRGHNRRHNLNLRCKRMRILQIIRLHVNAAEYIIKVTDLSI
jgi:hypothetical protein